MKRTRVWINAPFAAGLLAAALLASPAAPVLAKSRDPVLPAETFANRPQARIAFADSTGIRNWEARREQGDDVLYIEGLNRTWYRATFIGLCRDLNFATGLGFETRGTSELDRFSSILVPRTGMGRPDRCQLNGLVELTPQEAVALKLRGKPPAAAGAPASGSEPEAAKGTTPQSSPASPPAPPR